VAVYIAWASCVIWVSAILDFGRVQKTDIMLGAPRQWRTADVQNKQTNKQKEVNAFPKIKENQNKTTKKSENNNSHTQTPKQKKNERRNKQTATQNKQTNNNKSLVLLYYL